MSTTRSTGHGPASGPGGDPRRRIPALLTAIDTARERLQVELEQRAAGSREAEQARHALVLALEGYAAALAAAHLPMPYRLHAELRLQRGLGGH